MKLFIYLITRPKSGGYDSYDSVVAVASSERAARLTYPENEYKWEAAFDQWRGIADGEPPHEGHPWVDDPDTLTVTRVGSANPAAWEALRKSGPVLCASFNAG